MHQYATDAFANQIHICTQHIYYIKEKRKSTCIHELIGQTWVIESSSDAADD